MSIKYLPLVALVLPTFAWAQAPQQAPQQQLTPEIAACQQEILELTGGKFQWRAKANSLTQEIETLQRQLAELKSAPDPKKQ